MMMMMMMMMMMVVFFPVRAGKRGTVFPDRTRQRCVFVSRGHDLVRLMHRMRGAAPAPAGPPVGAGG